MRILVSSLIDLQKSAHNSRLHQFLKYLSKDHDVTVLSINDWWKAKWDDKSSEYQDDFKNLYSDIKFLYLTEKKLSPVLQDVFSIIRPDNITQVLKKDEYDIHFSYNCLFLGHVTAKYFDSKKVNTIYDIADDLPEMARTSPQIPGFLKPLSGLVSEIILNKNIQLAKRVTCTTNSLIHSYRIPSDKSVLLPNGVDTKLFKNVHSDHLRIKLGIYDCFVIGHIGVLREWLDFGPLFEAFRMISETINAKLLIVGGGIGYYETMQLADKYGVSKSIVFTGTVPYSQVPNYISCMDVGIIPFKPNKVSKNSLPLKLFEYMACEKPVISTKSIGIMQSVDGKVKYVSNCEEYKSELMHLYYDENLRKKLANDGRLFVEENYNWSKITSKLEKILLEMS